jgi:branched-chain amino acid transport system substrate-binding protein
LEVAVTPKLTRRIVLALGGAATLATPQRSFGATPIRVGVLTDLSGVYADLCGPGSAVAARMALDDCAGQFSGQLVELLVADHQNKAELGAALARKWYDVDGVGMIVGLDNSAVALAVQQVAAERDRVLIGTAIGSVDFTGKNCTATSASWVYDSYALTTSLGQALVATGQDTWFFVTVDYAFGQSLENDATRAVQAAGGRVLGGVKHPLGTADFSSYLLQAQNSGAKVIAFCNAGADLVNAIKQAGEFGLPKGGGTLAAMVLFITDIHSLGLPTAQGLNYVSAFYWDRTDESRAFAKRFYAQRSTMPTMVHAGVYSATRHYLRAVAATGPVGGAAIMAKMRETPVDDFYVHDGRLRADGRLMHDMFLMRVKTPAQSQGPWDYATIQGTIPADKAFRPLAQTHCPLVAG